MIKALQFIVNEIPWKVIGSVMVCTISVMRGITFIISWINKQRDSSLHKKSENAKLNACLSGLHKDVFSNPERYGNDTPPFRVQHWAENLKHINIPSQIQPENWDMGLTNEQKKSFKHIFELLEKHNEFVTQAKSANPNFRGKHPRDVYDDYMPKLRQAVSEYEEKES